VLSPIDSVTIPILSLLFAHLAPERMTASCTFIP